MKITIRENGGELSVYIPKKDTESKVTVTDPAHVFGGNWELQNGMKLFIEPLAEKPKLPLTVEARKL